MEIGMMWTWIKPSEGKTNKKDEDLALINFIKDAKEYHTEKYGIIPDTCQVNPADVEGHQRKDVKSAEEIGIRLVTSGSILKGCLWIGVDEKKTYPLREER